MPKPSTTALLAPSQAPDRPKDRLDLLDRFRSRCRKLVLDAVSSPETKRAYGSALDDFFDWCAWAKPGDLNKGTVTAYRAHLEHDRLSPSTVNVHLAAVKKLAIEAADAGELSPETAGAISRVKGAKRLGTRTGNWLSLAQAEHLIIMPDPDTLKGLRDRALLGLAIGTGLRRKEIAQLQFEQIQQREGRWVIVDLVGKGARIRSVPMPAWTKSLIDKWIGAAGIAAGHVFRPVNKGNHIAGDHMTAQSVFVAVKKYTKWVSNDSDSIAPHDLRRTFAKLAHKGRAPLEQIQLSMGHASIQTTERYLGVQQDLEDAPCDHLGIRIQT